MTNRLIRDVKEVIRRLRNRGISFDGNRQYPAIPTIDDTVESHTNALRAIREAMETHERRNPRATLDSFVRLYELEDVLGGFKPGEASVPWATHEEVDAGTPRYKAVDPETGAYAYDRLRHGGQHEAGKGTQTVALTDGATIDVDCSLSNVFSLTIGGDRTLNEFTNPYNGQVIKIRIKQDATGGWDITWPANVRWVQGGTPVLSTDPGAVDVVYLGYDENDDVWEGNMLPDLTGTGTGWANFPAGPPGDTGLITRASGSADAPRPARPASAPGPPTPGPGRGRARR